MICGIIDEKLLSLTASKNDPEFSPEERTHIGTCSRCQAKAAWTASALARIARSGAEREPDPSYWPTIIPRVRAGTEKSIRSFAGTPVPRIARAVLPAAAFLVVALISTTVVIDPPLPRERPDLLATLSESELQELRLSGKHSGLLEAVDANGEAETPLSEFIADLISDGGDPGIAALSDPEEFLHQVDDAQFVEIVSILNHTYAR